MEASLVCLLIVPRLVAAPCLARHAIVPSELSFLCACSLAHGVVLLRRFGCRVCLSVHVLFLFSKAALIALGYEEVALDDFWQTFLQELDALPNMEISQLEVHTRI